MLDVTAPAGVPAPRDFFDRAPRLSHAGVDGEPGRSVRAKRTGYELVRRSDLLPNEKQRANEVYYKLELAELEQKIPPILNPTMRPISFIYTTCS